VKWGVICGQIRLIEIMEPRRKRGGNESKSLLSWRNQRE
jgi:hypothetical protein